MSNSNLVNYTMLSPFCTKPRKAKIDKITIHHMAGNLSVETCGNVFQNRSASANYGIGTDGRVGMYVEEANRSWCSSNSANDNRAVTIEVANDEIGGNWHISDAAMAKLIDLCVDICKRNGIAKLNFTGDKSGNLTMHKWFTATACPGPYLESKFPYIADEVNKRLASAEENKPKVEEEDEVKLPMLRKGNKGKTVKALQVILIAYGYNLGYYGADGSFGSNTDAAVRAFQKSKGLEADGICGPLTWAKLLGVS